MKKTHFISTLQALLPQHLLTAFAGCLANCTIPWVKNILIRYFLWQYTINLEEAFEPNPFNYPSFNAFFTRALNSKARTIAKGVHDLISPADGYVSQFGAVQEGSILQIKNHRFRVQDLLDADPNVCEPFLSGSFITVYLAPENYHRVHMPTNGHLSKMTYIPGKLFPVNFNSVSSTPNLFARNERVVNFFDTAEFGKIAVVLVGAMIVGSIETVWSGTVSPPRKQLRSWNYDPTIHLNQGEEMGRFKLGSTVIVITEKHIQWDPSLREKLPLQMGQKIGTFKPDHS